MQFDELVIQCRSALERQNYDACVQVALRSQFRTTPEISYYVGYAEYKKGNTFAALRTLLQSQQSTPILRRLEVELLCKLRLYDLLKMKLILNFTEFPEHAVDMIYFSINELVFNRAFAEARSIIDDTTPSVLSREPGLILDLRERIKFIDETEENCSRAIVELANIVSPVKDRLQGIDAPKADWVSIVPGDWKTLQSAQVVNIDYATANSRRNVQHGLFLSSEDSDFINLQPLPAPKDTLGVIVREARLIDIYNSLNLYSADGFTFPQFNTRRSITNAGLTLSVPTEKNKIFESAVMLPPLGDPGFFNAILNGLYSTLVWRDLFPTKPLIVPAGYNDVVYEYINKIALPSATIHRTTNETMTSVGRCLVLLNEGRSISAHSVRMFKDRHKAFWQSSVTSSQTPDKLYISRSKAKQRPLVSENKLEELLKSRGFKICHFETMNFSEQIETCKHCKVIVAPHGAGLTNMIFSDNLQLVVELIPKSYHVRGFENLASQMGARYLGLIGSCSAETELGSMSWSIDFEHLTKIVDDELAAVR